MKKEPIILAFCGKGGVGKTSLSAICIRILNETYPDKKILAIDADPAIGLATALGVKASSTVDDIRKLFIENVENGNTANAMSLLAEAKYQIYDALVELNNVSFLAIGRPEGAGCYCKVNAYLKEVIALLASNYDYVVIDGEAGIEQVNRRVMEKVTHLILVSDASKKGLEVAKTIQKVSSELVISDKVGLILNRIINKDILNSLDLNGLNLLSAILNDEQMILSDVKGDSIYMLDKSALVMKGMQDALRKLDIIK